MSAGRYHVRTWSQDDELGARVYDPAQGVEVRLTLTRDTDDPAVGLTVHHRGEVRVLDGLLADVATWLPHVTPSPMLTVALVELLKLRALDPAVSTDDRTDVDAPSWPSRSARAWAWLTRGPNGRPRQTRREAAIGWALVIAISASLLGLSAWATDRVTPAAQADPDPWCVLCAPHTDEENDR